MPPNKVEQPKDSSMPFTTIALFFLGIVALSTIFFHYVEDWRWLDSIYFVIVTVATVGYGNIVPQTDLGKIGNMALIVVGIGAFGVFANQLLKRRAIRHLERTEKQKQK